VISVVRLRALLALGQSSVNDLLIRNGQLVIGDKVVAGDVAVHDGIIVEIGQRLSLNARRVIEAEGMHVCPGFIDMHSHSDLALLDANGKDWKLRQGVTTEVIGNCGFSLFPVLPEHGGEAFDFLASLFSGISRDDLCKDLAEYFRRLEKPNINVVSFVGHNMLRIGVNGNDAEISSQRMGEMGKLLDEQLEQGAAGMSTGLIYLPACFADNEELLGLARGVKKRGKIMAWHIRSEGDGEEKALQEVLDVAQVSGVNTEISHLKVSGRRNHGRMSCVLEEIERSIGEGNAVAFDAYPYTFGNTTILTLLPDWALADKLPDLCDKLAGETFRERIRADMRKSGSVFMSVGSDKIILAACNEAENEEMQGRSLEEAARLRGSDVCELVMDLIVSEKGKTSIFLFQADERDLRLALASKYGVLGTDGIPLGDKSHSRLENAFLRFLGHCVAVEKICSLPEAVAKMSLLPARNMGLTRRGGLEAGNFADICIFDLDKIKVQERDGLREQWRGVDYVVLNGKVVVEKTEYNGVCAGRNLTTDKH